MCYHNRDWDNIAHITAMAYNVFQHSSPEEAPFIECLDGMHTCPHCLNYYYQKSDTWEKKM